MLIFPVFAAHQSLSLPARSLRFLSSSIQLFSFQTITRSSYTTANRQPLESIARHSSLATVLNSFPFIRLRALLHSSKTQLSCFQAISNSFTKNIRVGYGGQRKDRKWRNENMESFPN